jgi:hypothetical protein
MSGCGAFPRLARSGLTLLARPHLEPITVAGAALVSHQLPVSFPSRNDENTCHGLIECTQF